MVIVMIVVRTQRRWVRDVVMNFMAVCGLVIREWLGLLEQSRHMVIFLFVVAWNASCFFSSSRG